MMRTRFTFPLLAALLALLAGCASVPTPTSLPAPGEEWIRNALQDTALFLATDDTLGKQIEIGDVNAYTNRETNGFKATCQFRNLTEKPITLQIHALFRDNAGTTLYTTPWQSYVLAPGKYVPFEISDESGATRVLVELRPFRQSKN
jgi:hypothetical protein